MFRHPLHSNRPQNPRNVEIVNVGREQRPIKYTLGGYVEIDDAPFEDEVIFHGLTMPRRFDELIQNMPIPNMRAICPNWNLYDFMNGGWGQSAIREPLYDFRDIHFWNDRNTMIVQDQQGIPAMMISRTDATPTYRTWFTELRQFNPGLVLNAEALERALSDLRRIREREISAIIRGCHPTIEGNNSLIFINPRVSPPEHT